MRSTPHDYYLEVLDRVLIDAGYSEDEVSRILRATGLAWETVFKGHLVVPESEPLEWEAQALSALFDGVRVAFNGHPMNDRSHRDPLGRPILTVLTGGKRGT